MALLLLPEPYDFELSTERYRAFGPDRANLWHEGGLHRVVDGREVRIESAPGGVNVDPLDDRIELVALTLLGVEFDLGGFYEFATGDSVLAELASRLAGLRPPLNPDPFETLVTSISAQQVSLHAAFAVRNRLIERYGDPGTHAIAFPRPERLRDESPEDLLALGFSRRKAEYVLGLAEQADELDELAELPDEDVKARLGCDAWPRRMDGGLVPRAPPRPPARLARRRPRPSAGRSALSTSTGACRRSMRLELWGRASLRSRT